MSVPPVKNTGTSSSNSNSFWAMNRRLGRDIEKAIKKRLKHLRIQTLFVGGLGIALTLTCLGVYMVVPRWAYGDPLSADQWGAIEGFAALATFAFGVTAGLFVVVEIMEASDSRNLEIYQDIYEKFMSEDQIAARRFIYRHIPDGWTGEELNKFILIYEHIPDGTSGEELREFVHNFDDANMGELTLDKGEKLANDQVKSVLNAIDYFGFLAQQDWVTAEEMIGWVSPIVVKVWEKIEPLVDYEIQKRPTEPDYYEAACQLAQKCRQWRQEHHPKASTQRTEFGEDRL